MSIRSAMFAIVSANTAVTAIIGTNPTKLYPDVIPQGVNVPAAVYQGAGGTPENTLADDAVADYKRLQIWSWGSDADQAEALAEALRTALTDQAALFAQGIGCQCIGFTTSTFEAETERYGVLYDYGFWIGR